MIKIGKMTECLDPKFVKPKLLHYTHDGKQKSWEIVETHDSVAILLYDESQDSFVLVKQFRPAIFLKNQDGFTYELCAGLIDKDKSIVTIAKEEILEECGYDICEDDIVEITSFFTAVGFAGGKQTLYFAKVSDMTKVSEGGGLEDENIEVIYLPLSEAKTFMYDQSIVKTPGLLFAFMWFFDTYKK